MPILLFVSVIVSAISLFLLHKFIFKTFVSSDRTVNIIYGVLCLAFAVVESLLVVRSSDSVLINPVALAVLVVPSIALGIWRKSVREVVNALCGVFVIASIASEISYFLSMFASWSSDELFAGVLNVFSLFVPLFIFIPLSKFSADHEREPFVGPIVVLMTVIILFIELVRNSLIDVITYSSITGVDLINSYLLSLLAAAVNIAMVMCFVLRSEDKYLKSVIHINDEMLNAQLTHYETVKQSNFELRRIRHDMKNHLLVIRDIADRGDMNELREYIDSLSQDVEASALAYRTGNDIVDAILSDKKAKADKRGIRLIVNGNLVGCSIDSVDMCTIIANLLDNAVEAVSKLYGMNASEDEYTIVLDFKRSGNYLYIVQTNYAIEKMVRLSDSRFATSKTSGDHGFGLYNIRKAVERNSGEMNINSEDGRFIKYSFEIILPMS